MVNVVADLLDVVHGARHGHEVPGADGTAWELTVSQCGRTAWVSAGDGSTIGRFSKAFGIDVHTTATEQIEGKGHCLFCTHEPAGSAEWDIFRAEILKRYGIDLPKDAMTF